MALLGRAAFKNCLVHGTLLAADGTKISKSRKNFTDPMELIDKHGADALRLYLLNSHAVAMEDMNFKDAGVPEQARRVLLPLWNVYAFFVTYANIDGYRGVSGGMPRPEHPLDRWILAVLQDAARRVTDAYRSFYLNHALAPLLDFLDDLTNWYVRQSRERFWGGGLTPDKRGAYDTLYYVLVTTVKLLAPAAPFLTDAIYRNLTGEESVHLADWPAVPVEYANADLVEETRIARLVVSLGLALRQQLGIRVRQPLAALTVAAPPAMLARLTPAQREVVAHELNVKKIVILRDYTELAELRAAPDARSIGPRWGRATQRIIRAAKAGQVREAGDQIVVFDGAEEWALDRGEVAISYVGRDGAEVMADRGVLVALDRRLTPALVEEGMANELNRLIQDLRKTAGYAVSDRIQLALEGPLAPPWRTRLAELALAEMNDIPGGAADAEAVEEIGGHKFRVAVRRV